MKSATRKNLSDKKPASGSKSTRASNALPVQSTLSRIHKPDDVTLEEWQRTLRRQFGEKQNFSVVNVGLHPLFSDFVLTNPQSGRTYKIAIRGAAPGLNYCSCPDYSINNLGTCKHIEFTLQKLRQEQGAEKQLTEGGYTPPYSEIYLSYGLKREIRFRPGLGASAEWVALAK